MKDTKRYLSYEEFGAVGDGIHDDFPAIVACHDYANFHSLPVKAKDGAIYYIGGMAITAMIMTDTDFGNARFIIDDRILENRLSYCFEIASANEEFTPEITKVAAGQKKIDFPHNGKLYIRVEGAPAKRVFIRKGLNGNKGAVPAESFIVDADGSILTDINWSYNKITKATAISVDDEPITVEGGIFTTVANQWLCSTYDTHNRGFHITRSNVTVRGMKHYIDDEHNEMGAPYGGFISVGRCYNTTLDDITLTPHYAYKRASSDPKQLVNMGTYDLNLTYSIGVTIKNLTQTRALTEWAFWGLMGSNFCKDITLINCTVSRFDAHCGITNGVIRNCRLGHAGLNLVGYGSFTIEDTEISAEHFIRFREDYGSSFDGTLTIKNCVWHPSYNHADLEVFCAYNDGTHYFGYDAVMTREMRIEGLTIDDSRLAPGHGILLFPSYDKEFSTEKPYPLKTPTRVYLSDVKTVSGKEIKLYENAELYAKTDFEIK